MKKRGSMCKWVPGVQVPGTTEEAPSRLYKDLEKLIKDRGITNLAYVYYVQPEVADMMDKAGYRRDALGQHFAKDVYKYLEVGKIKNSVLLPSEKVAKSEGFIDSSGNSVVFTDGEEAFNKAFEFNMNYNNKVAMVVPATNGWTISVLNKDANGLEIIANTERAISNWETLKTYLRDRGLNINELKNVDSKLFNPGTVKDLVNTLDMYKFIPIKSLSLGGIKLLLAMNPENSLVKSVYTRGWGNFDETAQTIYDIIQGVKPVSTATAQFVKNLIDSTSKFSEVNLKELNKELVKVNSDFNKLNPNEKMFNTLKSLDAKYGINSKIYLRNTREIKSVSDAIADAVMSVERQIRTLEAKKDRADIDPKYHTLKDTLLKELASKRYAGGLANFMKMGVDFVGMAMNELSKIKTTGTNLEKAASAAEVISTANNIIKNYTDIASRLMFMNDITNDLNITNEQKQELNNIAENLNKLLTELRTEMTKATEEGVTNLGIEFLGEENTLYGKSLADIINMMEVDSTLFDYLYSVGRTSNSIIGVEGAIIRDAQMASENMMRDFDLRIRRLNDIVSRNKLDTADFMYDEKGRIVSNYDWDSFFKRRAKHKRNLLASMPENSFELVVAMKSWEDENTELIEVDKKNHRFERVPIDKLKVPFDAGWTPAMKEYYQRAMEIKGEIGTLLPRYAQHQFIAPQKRKKMDEVIKDAIKRKDGMRALFNRIWDNMHLFKMKQGTNKFRKNGMFVGGEDVIAATSDFDNTILRQIPLFYTQKIDEADLSHDFSGSLSSLATTAVNYDHMFRIKDMVEMIVDFAKTNAANARDASGKLKADIVNAKFGDENVYILKLINKKISETNTGKLAEAFALKALYGVENKNEGPWNVFCSNLIGYTSIKGLSLNTLGAIANRLVGVVQTIIMGTRGQYFDMSDLIKAEAYIMGNNGATTMGTLTGGLVGGFAGAGVGYLVGKAIGAAGRYGPNGKIMDILTDNRNSKDSLIADFFDSENTYMDKMADRRFHSTKFGRIMGTVHPLAFYERGEYWIHMLCTYAILFHEKVLQYDPKTNKYTKISLYDALDRGEKIDGNSELIIKDNIFNLNGEAIKGTNNAYFDAIRRRIRYANQNCHGSMNKEDKGIIHQWMLGKLIMNFRQWMVEHYSRRYRGLHWDESIRDVDFNNFYHKTKVNLNGKRVSLIDALEMVTDNKETGEFHYKIADGATTLGKDPVALTDEVLNEMLDRYAEDSGWRRGYINSTFKIFKDFFKWHRDYKEGIATYWDTLSETQKSDCKEALGEAFVLMMLTSASVIAGDPDKYKRDFFARVWMYEMKRILFDEKAATPWGAVMEAKTIIQSPIAAAKTMSGLLYPIFGISDIGQTVKSGRHKGENRYLKNIKKYTLPFYGQTEQLFYLDEDDYMFDVFANTIR